MFTFYFLRIDNLVNNNINLFVLGCLFIFFVYHISIIIEKKEPPILYYSFYILALMIYFCIKLDFVERPIWYGNIAKNINYPIQPIIWIFYTLFIRKILNLKVTIPKWDVFLKITEWVLLGFSLLFILLNNFASYQTFKLVAIIFSIAVILVAIFNNFIVYYYIKSKIGIYFLIGSTIFLISSIIAFYLTIYKNSYSIIEPINYMQIGSIIEIFMFSLIIANKIKLDKEKKEELELLYNHKLNEIDTLQQIIARNLEMERSNNKHLLLEELNSISKNKLTKREFEILEQVSQGFNNNEIAETLFISLNTVKFHLKNIYDKLDVKNRIQASQFFNQI